MNQRGSSLLEVMVALGIAAIAATSIFSVFVSIFGTQADLSVYIAAETSLSGLSDALGRYVAEDISDAADAPGGSWRLPGDSCSYALAQGCTHDATAAFLDPLVAARRPGAKLTYVVEPDPGAQAVRVTMSLAWP